MKLNITPRTNEDAEATRWAKQIAYQVNAISEGRIVGFYAATTAAPTTGAWAQGDFIHNSAPTELGAVSSKYTIAGWRCVASGTPGTWVQCRQFTGN